MVPTGDANGFCWLLFLFLVENQRLFFTKPICRLPFVHLYFVLLLYLLASWSTQLILWELLGCFSISAGPGEGHSGSEPNDNNSNNIRLSIALWQWHTTTSTVANRLPLSLIVSQLSACILSLSLSLLIGSLAFSPMYFLVLGVSCPSLHDLFLLLVLLSCCRVVHRDTLSLSFFPSFLTLCKNGAFQCTQNSERPRMTSSSSILLPWFAQLARVTAFFPCPI